MQQVFIGCLLRIGVVGDAGDESSLHSALGCVGADSLMMGVLEVADRGDEKRAEVVSLYWSFVWTCNYFDQRILELFCFVFSTTTAHFSGFLFISWQSLSAQLHRAD